MPVTIFSTTDLKKLLFNGWWALKLVWSTNAIMTAGLVISADVRALIPAGLAIFARGLINVCVANSGLAVGLDAILPWFLLGFGITILIGYDILSHAEKLDLAFFENAAKRDLLDRAQQSPAEPFMAFVAECQS